MFDSKEVAMFGGIVETVGDVTHLKKVDHSMEITVKPKMVLDDLQLGDSVAVNGVCLTVCRFLNDAFIVTAVPETLAVTNMADLEVGASVNIERALLWQGRIGGHLMQGHVDFVGEIVSIALEGNAKRITIRSPNRFAKYLVDKGYVALDGMSITVISALEDCFSITLIPHTANVTIANRYEVGSRVNIEVDILGKYIEKLMGKAHANCN